jgi:hypothetical protein
MWEPKDNVSWFELYQPLARVLFAIGFLGCAPRPSSVPVYDLDDPMFMNSESNVEHCEYFFIHRTYHSAVDIHTTTHGRG